MKTYPMFALIEDRACRWWGVVLWARAQGRGPAHGRGPGDRSEPGADLGAAEVVRPGEDSGYQG